MKDIIMKDIILSIQSKVAYGFVGNNAAELAIQLHGLDIISLPTVYLAAHTGHLPVYGDKISKRQFDDLIKGVKSLDIADKVAYVISGYMGSEEVLDSAVRYIGEIKAAYPEKLYVCDPVMGDDEELYIEEKLARAMITKLLPLSDIIIPNHFEFRYITDTKAETKEEIIETLASDTVLKDKTVVITGCVLSTTPAGKIETLIICSGECKSIVTEKIDIDTTGTGDLFSAVAVSQLTMGKSLEEAVVCAANTVKLALKYIAENGIPEMNARSILQSILDLK